MKNLRNLLVCLLFALSTGVLAPAIARAQDDAAAPPVSFDYFYNALQPYGQWVQIDGYGYCWQPNGIDENWQPYTDGYWTYTDAGWTWMSYEDFGWVTYHYGRWTRVEDFGWVWVPDYEWAPAWVSWRESDEYVGWAPLPPECHFQADIGVSYWADTTYDIGPDYYNFCAVQDFGSPSLRQVICARGRGAAIILGTVNITNITINNGIIFNGGPNYGVISHRVFHPIQTLRLVRDTHPGNFGPGHNPFAQARGGELFIHAPLIKPPTREFRPPQAVRIITSPKVDRGWAHVSDPGVRQQIQQKFKTDSHGVKPAEAPARPITPQQLAVIPPRGSSPQPTAFSRPVNQSNQVVIPGHSPAPVQHFGGNSEPQPPTPKPTRTFQPFNGTQAQNPPNGSTTPANGWQERKVPNQMQEQNIQVQQQQQRAAAEAAAREQQRKAAEAAQAQAAEAQARQQQYMQQRAASQQQQQSPPQQQQQQHYQQQQQNYQQRSQQQSPPQQQQQQYQQHSQQQSQSQPSQSQQGGYSRGGGGGNGGGGNNHRAGNSPSPGQ